MIENSIWFLGDLIFNDMVEGLVDKYSHGYQMQFWARTPIITNDIVETWFNFDYRQVKAPYIGNGFVDFFMMGELEYAYDSAQGTTCQFNPKAMNWVSQKNEGPS
jgi:hypothetical protein